MPNHEYEFSHRPTGVERACQIAKNFFQHARGHHDTDAATVRTIARRAHLTPAEVRQFLQPSRRPKDVRLGVWQRLVGAYRRYLERELAALQDEIDRLADLDPDDRALLDLLHEAENLERKILLALSKVPPGATDRNQQF